MDSTMQKENRGQNVGCMKIVALSNFDREDFNEFLLLEKIDDIRFAKVICEALNKNYYGEYSEIYCEIVDDNYKLKKFEP
jgi:hypothetical protein